MPWVPTAVPRPAGSGTDSVEVTVSAGPEEGHASLRATFDYWADGDDFNGRLAASLAAGRVALDALPGPLDGPAGSAFEDLAAAAYPRPDAIHPRTYFAGWLGVSVDPRRPGALTGAKLYVNLAAPGGAGPVAVAAGWPDLEGPLAVLAEGEPRMAAVRVGAGGRLWCRAYARALPSGGHGLVAQSAARTGLDGRMVLADVQRSGFGRALWTDDVVVKVEAPAGGSLSDFAVHLSAAPLRDPARAWDLAAATLARVAGDDELAAGLLERAGADRGRWDVAGLGLAYRLDGSPSERSLDRVNVYVQPRAGAPV